MSITAKEQLKEYLETPRYDGDDGEASAEFALAAMNFVSESIFQADLHVQNDDEVVTLDIEKTEYAEVIDAFVESEGDRDEIRRLREKVIS